MSRINTFNETLENFLARVTTDAGRIFQHLETGKPGLDDLPKISDQAIRQALINALNRQHGYSIEPAIAIAADILEDVNAHPEAAQVRELLNTSSGYGGMTGDAIVDWINAPAKDKNRRN